MAWVRISAVACIGLGLCLDTGCYTSSPPVSADATVYAPPDAGPDAAPPIAVTALSVGGDHACAILDSSRLLCWGGNRRGQAGQSSEASVRVLVPSAVGDDSGWSAVDAGTDHTCGIRGGLLYCWGDNRRGQLGLDMSVDHSDDPVPPVGATGEWLAVSAGDGFTCGIRADAGERRIFCWGTDDSNQLGDGPGDTSGPFIRQVATVASNWVSVSAGANHVCARRESDAVYCWGANEAGQLGNGDTTSRASPTRVLEDDDDGVTLFSDVSAGAIATCAVGINARLYCWGSNDAHQLGTSLLTTSLIPHGVSMNLSWTGVSLSRMTACARRLDGAVSCWGDGSRGAVGNADWGPQTFAEEIPELDDATLVSVGEHSACAAPAEGGLMCWGDNPEGELGIGHTSTAWTPSYIPHIQDAFDGTLGWDSVSVGAEHICGSQGGSNGPTSQGAVWCWGSNSDGAVLGPPTSDGVTRPRPLDNMGDGLAWVTVGGSSTCAAFEDGDLWCWGRNSHGEVAHGDLGSVVGAVDVGGAGPRLASTAHATCTYDINYGRWCWGEGTGFGLGNGASDDVLTPTKVDSIGWRDLSLGRHFGCGVHWSDSALECWGSDDFGQQGDGVGATPAPTPHVIAAGTTFTRVAAAWNGDHACAISTNGDLYCWGRNDLGQCGVTAGAQLDAPVLVSDTGDWTRIAAGATHTCGIRNATGGTETGQLYCWGAATEAQLGLDLGVDHVATPMLVGNSLLTLGGWWTIEAGESNTCGLWRGVLYCWGPNVRGQIGDGTSAHNTPQPVALPAM